MKDHLDGLTKQTIGAALAVHRELGPGLFEIDFNVTRLAGHGIRRVVNGAAG